MNPTDAELLNRLHRRDLAILDDLEQFRLLTSRHIQQLHFPVSPGAHATKGGATRATLRVLNRLRDIRLVTALQRRIGGVRHGSQGLIWQLTSFGDRIQRARRHEVGRRRYTEPGLHHLQHTLAVTGVAVLLKRLERAGALEVKSIAAEPACWRTFPGPHGVPTTLKPDLYAETATGPWEDYWFIEVDRDTMHPPSIIKKCRTYASYAAIGAEQERHSVFPAVIWIVPHQERKSVLTSAIKAESSLPQELFQVITLEELPSLLTINE